MFHTLFPLLLLHFAWHHNNVTNMFNLIELEAIDEEGQLILWRQKGYSDITSDDIIYFHVQMYDIMPYIYIYIYG